MLIRICPVEKNVPSPEGSIDQGEVMWSRGGRGRGQFQYVRSSTAVSEKRGSRWSRRRAREEAGGKRREENGRALSTD